MVSLLAGREIDAGAVWLVSRCVHWIMCVKISLHGSRELRWKLWLECARAASRESDEFRKMKFWLVGRRRSVLVGSEILCVRRPFEMDPAGWSYEGGVAEGRGGEVDGNVFGFEGG